MMATITEHLMHTWHCMSIRLLSPVSSYTYPYYTDKESEIWWGKDLPKATQLKNDRTRL